MVGESIYAKAFQLSPIAMSLLRVKDGKFLDINRSLEELFDVKKENLIGNSAFNFMDRSVDGDRDRIQSIFLEKGKLTGERLRFKNSTGTISEILVYANNFTISDDSYVLGMNLDVTQTLEIEKKLAKSLEEKEVLLKELQHRVKNSLAIVSGLLSMEAYKVTDETAKRSFLNAQSRITSMSKVYESLYQSQDLETVHLGDYVNSLVNSMQDIFVLHPERVRFELKTDNILLDLKRALPLGLILNELLTNALKYAYPGDSSGVIRVELTKKLDNINLIVSDDGVGLPENVNGWKESMIPTICSGYLGHCLSWKPLLCRYL
jgi:PAS domain S-box-containing protein